MRDRQLWCGAGGSSVYDAPIKVRVTDDTEKCSCSRPCFPFLAFLFSLLSDRLKKTVFPSYTSRKSKERTVCLTNKQRAQISVTSSKND